MTDRLRVSTRTARSKGYARINNNPAFYAGMVFVIDNGLITYRHNKNTKVQVIPQCSQMIIILKECMCTMVEYQ